MKLSTLFLVIASFVLVSCGGGSSSSSSTSGSSTSSLSATYPEGVAGTSPTSISDSSGTVVAQLPLNRRIKDWGLALIDLIRSQDLNSLKRFAFATVPIDSAWAAPAKVPEASTIGDFISRVAAGTAIPSSTNLDLNAFLQIIREQIVMALRSSIQITRMMALTALYQLEIRECGWRAKEIKLRVFRAQRLNLEHSWSL